MKQPSLLHARSDGRSFISRDGISSAFAGSIAKSLGANLFRATCSLMRVARWSVLNAIQDFVGGSERVSDLTH